VVGNCSCSKEGRRQHIVVLMVLLIQTAKESVNGHM
jgi:hypothetical protein